MVHASMMLQLSLFGRRDVVKRACCATQYIAGRRGGVQPKICRSDGRRRRRWRHGAATWSAGRTRRSHATKAATELNVNLGDGARRIAHAGVVSVSFFYSFIHLYIYMYLLFFSLLSTGTLSSSTRPSPIPAETRHRDNNTADTT